MPTLKFNETKFTSRKAFIDNLFTLENEKEFKIDERTLSGDCPQIVDLSVNLQTANATNMWFSGVS